MRVKCLVEKIDTVRIKLMVCIIDENSEINGYVLKERECLLSSNNTTFNITFADYTWAYSEKSGEIFIYNNIINI